MFRNQSSANEIFEAMRSNLVKTAKAQASEERELEIVTASNILGLNAVAEKLEQTGRFKAAAIVTNMMVKMAGDPAEEIEGLPETIRPSEPEIDPQTYEAVVSGKFSPSMLVLMRRRARDRLEELRGMAEKEFPEGSARVIIDRFEKQLNDLDDAFTESLTVPERMRLFEQYMDFMRQARAFLEPDEGEEQEDIASAKDKKEIKKLLEMLGMFGFKKKDVDNDEDEPEGETAEFLSCLK